MKRAIIQLHCCLLFAFCCQAQITFEDTSSILFYPTITSGAPIGVVDMNGDGLDDIVTLDNTSHLYIQYQTGNGTFTGFDGGNLGGSQWSLCVADVDRNGYNDIFTGGSYNGLKLLRANSSGSAYTTEALEGNIFLQGSNFADIDNDNHIDIFACHDDGLSHPYRNDGEGNFSLDFGLISAESTFPSDNSGNYGSVWTDYDNDGDLDLYISKCRLGVIQPTDGRRMNLLFQNDGFGNYTDVASEAGLLPLAQSWATDFADIDNDGDLDAFIINHDLTCQLRENQNNGTFINITNSSGILTGLEGAGFGLQCKFEDFDNDGYVDLLFTSIGGHHVLFRNNGNKTFTSLPDALSPFARIHSAATGDLNNDGFIDVYAGYGISYNGTTNNPDLLFFNMGNNNNYFKVLLTGVFSNANGIGARLELYGSWGKQIREVRSGESYGIMTSFVSHFGIGMATSIDSLVVRWPSGTVDRVVNPDINQQLMITEGEYCEGNADFTYSVNQLFVNFQDASNVSAEEWLWTFGDGFSSTEQNPSHQYQQPDVYEVCLQIGGTCITCEEIALNCNVPDASFGASEVGLTVSFEDQSSSNPTEWFWTFGESGASSFEQNPSHTYTEPGTYVVCLIAANDCGETQFCDFITVACDIPEAEFNYEADELAVEFSDTSLPGATAWFWTFGDGGVSDEQNPQHEYSAPGTYLVCFEINNDCGTETTCEEITLSCTPPTADFDYAAQNLMVAFSNQSTVDAETWEWTFGDGAGSDLEDPFHQYAEAGTYLVCLTVSSICGSNQICQELAFSCAAPLADFVTNISQLSVNFGDISSNNPTGWLWDFGDGNNSTEEFTQHSYAEPGTYEVCLTVSNDCGSDQACQNLQVTCSTPVPDFTFSENELTLSFQDASQNEPLAWAWVFGDGSFSDQQNPQHSYAEAGVYEVCLTVSNDCGAATDCQSIVVGCVPPGAGFNFSFDELELNFQDISTNNPEEWLWNFGDGNTSTQQHPVHIYAIPGIYEVCLNASNSCGSDQTCQQILVSCSAPQALFSYTSSDLLISFNDLSPDNPSSWLWTFGDGSSSTDQNPQHTYGAPGMYEVCLVVSSVCGTTQRCEQLVVSCAAPVPSFSIIYNELMVNFVDQSANEPTSWLWDFGDGMGSSDQNPQHSYAGPGIYEVCLTTSSVCGSNSVCIEIEISCAAPEANFSFEQNGLSLSFTDLSGNEPTEWLWDFGDGNFSINQNPIHLYQSEGLQMICLIATSICGSDTLCQEIDLVVDNEAIPPPAVGIHLFPNPAMEILEVNFLHMDGRVKQLKVFDISGKQWLGIREVAGFQNEDKIDIDLLPPGVYYLDVSTELERVLERFVKL